MTGIFQIQIYGMKKHPQCRTHMRTTRIITVQSFATQQSTKYMFYPSVVSVWYISFAARLRTIWVCVARLDDSDLAFRRIFSVLATERSSTRRGGRPKFHTVPAICSSWLIHMASSARCRAWPVGTTKCKGLPLSRCLLVWHCNLCRKRASNSASFICTRILIHMAYVLWIYILLEYISG